MPLQPASLNHEAIHYFMEPEGVEDQNVGNVEEVEEDSADETQVEVHHHIQ